MATYVIQVSGKKVEEIEAKDAAEAKQYCAKKYAGKAYSVGKK